MFCVILIMNAGGVVCFDKWSWKAGWKCCCFFCMG